MEGQVDKTKSTCITGNEEFETKIIRKEKRS